jgi:hypothetical protein
MASNINTNNYKYQDRTLFDFRSRLVGGGARPNLFECEIPFPNITGINMSSEDLLDLKFLIKAAQLPGSNIGSIPVPFRGRTLKIAGDRTYDPWTITVINDTKFNLRDAFEQWSNVMNRHDDSAGVITPSLYQTNILVRQLSRGDTIQTAQANSSTKVVETNSDIQTLKAYRLYGCFPTSVDPIPLSYDSNDSIEEFNVTFEVQYWDAYNPSSKVGNDSIFGINENDPVVASTTQA